MKLSEAIKLNTHYTRSINLERDFGSFDLVESYIPTSRSLQTLTSIADTLSAIDCPRSWAMVGPYGSGKSSFAVFLSHLLGNRSNQATRQAQEKLGKIDSNLSSRFNDVTDNGLGYCRILLTGSSEPLGKKLAQATLAGALDFWSGRRGPTPKIIHKLKSAVDDGSVSTSDIVGLIKDLQNAVKQSNGNGIIIIIDELGKFLEYGARHDGADDIYTLQMLAEHAYSAGIARLHLVVLLHQSFEHYARSLGESLKNEWSKVQGRFESIPFIESTEQTLRVVRPVFSSKFSSGVESEIKKASHRLAIELHAVGALPGTMNAATASELFEGCYPLHPLSLLLLPPLCQKVAQNERTLFSYLGSSESHGLHHSLSKLEVNNDELPWIHPWEIYEYFILNQPAALSDSVTHHRWAEVVTAVERISDSSDDEVRLLKTIGLFNIIGAQGGLKASNDVLNLCFGDNSTSNKRRVASTLKSLMQKSCLTYRKFSAEYRVWQGSDFDIEAELRNEKEQIGRIELADKLNGLKPIPPIVARRYTISTGAVRYFTPVFVDNISLSRLDKSGNEPEILLMLAESSEDEAQFKLAAKQIENPLCLVMVCSNGLELRSAVMEVHALERIQRNNQAVNNDPVAQRELRDRLWAAQKVEQDLIESLLLEPNANKWYRRGKMIEVANRRIFQRMLSEALESVFPDTPVIKNELLNRTKPSSTAMAGRNKLFAAMIEHEAEPDLAIQKYPAEKGMYKSVLFATGIHHYCEGKWKFSAPAKVDKYKVAPAWRAIEEYFERSEKGPLRINEIYEELQRPPFGVKAGLLPVIFLAAYLSRQDELALYDDGHFCPVLNHTTFEKIVKKPDDFTVQRFRLTGIRASLFKKYAEIVHSDSKDEPSLLGVIRPIARFMNQLPDYAKKTASVSPEAKAVLEAFHKAKSPADLLFNDMPIACGFHGFSDERYDSGDVEKYSKKVLDILRELGLAYPKLLDSIQLMLKNVFLQNAGMELSKLRTTLGGRYGGLIDYTVDVEGLRAFLMRLSDLHGDDNKWLEGLASFLGRKQPNKWADADIQQAEFRLIEFSKRIMDLEELRLAYEQKKGGALDFEAVLLRVVRPGKPERGKVICVDDHKRAAVKKARMDIDNLLSEIPEKELRLALLAELVENEIGEAQDDKAEARRSASKDGAA